MKRAVSLSLLFCLLSAASAFAQARVSERALGKIDPKLSDSQPGVELARLVEKTPGADVYVITGTVAVTPNVTDHNKYLYDRAKRLLLVMTRTAMPAGEDVFHWRVWRDVVSSDFRAGLPYRNAEVKTEASKWGVAKETLPLKYSGQPGITAWP